MQVLAYTGVFTTVANDIWFQVYNANIPAGISPGLSQSGYKFLGEVIDLDKLTGEDREYLGDYTFVPNTDGYAYFSVNKIVDSIIDNDQFDTLYTGENIGIYPTVYSSIMSPDIAGYSKYNLRLGNVWNPQLQFNYNFDYSGNVGLSFSTPHYLQVYDEIRINTYDPTTLVGQEIITTVASVIDDYAIELNEPYSLGYIAVGTIVFAKQWLTSLPVPFYAWNGAIDYGQENQLNGAYGGWVDDNLVFRYDLVTNTTIGQFLTPFGMTSSQSAKKLLYEDYETLTFVLPHNWFNNYDNWELIVTNYDENWNSLGTSNISLSFTEINPITLELTGYNKFCIGVGPQNINLQYPGTITSNNYSVKLHSDFTDSGNTYTFETPEYYYQIETDCSPFTNTRLIWTNRLGGYDCFNFRMNSQRNEGITRKEYTKILEPFYKTGSRGNTLITVETNEEWTINTNWITEQEYLALNDLVTSIDVAVVSFDPSLGAPTTYPIIITDTTYTQKTQLTEKLFNMTIKYKLAYEKYIQYR